MEQALGVQHGEALQKLKNPAGQVLRGRVLMSEGGEQDEKQAGRLRPWNAKY